MQPSTIKASLWAFSTSVGFAIAAPSCGDGDPTTNPATTGGATARGGSTNGGTGGSATGGDAGEAGTTTGGRGGTAGSAGSGGGGGDRGGGGGVGGGGGEANQGGMGGEGGEGETSVTLYDFESGVQGWTTSATGVSQSTDQSFDGTNSLKVTHGALDNGNFQVTVSGAPVWPNTVLTFHAYLPPDLDTTGGTYFQAFTQADNYNIGFDTLGNSARTAVSGGWTTWTYTVPNTFPGGLQVLGFQLGDNSGGSTIAAGDIYLDAITATGGTQTCAQATPAGLHNFETSPLDGNVYKIDGTNNQTSIAQSTDRAVMGTGSMKVSFANLPAPTGTEPTKRIIYIDKPVIYCGQTITVQVFLPTGSDGLTFQIFAQYNNYGAFTGTGARTVTQNMWNSATFMVPTNVGPGGIQRVGLEFMYSGSAAFTGDAYVDAISW